MTYDTPAVAWTRLGSSARRRRPKMLDMFGCWSDAGDQNWTVRLGQDWVVEYEGVAAAIDFLSEDLMQVERLDEVALERGLAGASGLGVQSGPRTREHRVYDSGQSLVFA